MKRLLFLSLAFLVLPFVGFGQSNVLMNADFENNVNFWADEQVLYRFSSNSTPPTVFFRLGRNTEILSSTFPVPDHTRFLGLNAETNVPPLDTTINTFMLYNNNPNWLRTNSSPMLRFDAFFQGLSRTNDADTLRERLTVNYLQAELYRNQAGNIDIRPVADGVRFTIFEVEGSEIWQDSLMINLQIAKLLDSPFLLDFVYTSTLGQAGGFALDNVTFYNDISGLNVALRNNRNVDFFVINKPLPLNLQVSNLLNTPVNSFRFNWELVNTTTSNRFSGNRSFVLDTTLDFDESYTINGLASELTLTELGNYQTRFYIDRVNGRDTTSDDLATDDTLEFNINTVSSRIAKKVFLETQSNINFRGVPLSEFRINQAIRARNDNRVLPTHHHIILPDNTVLNQKPDPIANVISQESFFDEFGAANFHAISYDRNFVLNPNAPFATYENNFNFIGDTLMSPVSIEITEATLNANTREVTVNYTTNWLSNLTNNFRVNGIITEDSLFKTGQKATIDFSLANSPAFITSIDSSGINPFIRFYQAADTSIRFMRFDNVFRSYIVTTDSNDFDGIRFEPNIAEVRDQDMFSGSITFTLPTGIVWENAKLTLFIANALSTGSLRVWNADRKSFRELGIVPTILASGNTIGHLLKVYPIPAQSTLYVTYSAKEQATADLISITGQTVHKQNIQEGVNELHLGQVDKGVYLLKINSAKGGYTQKVVLH